MFGRSREGFRVCHPSMRLGLLFGEAADSGRAESGIRVQAFFYN